MKSLQEIQNELLVLKCRTGDRAALEALVERWQQRLWRHARLVIGEEDAAWDAVQETWVAIVNGISKLEQAGAFPAWAYKILTGKCADIIRRRQRQRRMTDDLTTEAEHAEENPPRDDGQDALKSAVSRLPENERSILSLHYVEGYTTQEIADILGVAQGTVKARLFDAREHVRRLMGHS